MTDPVQVVGPNGERLHSGGNQVSALFYQEVGGSGRTGLVCRECGAPWLDGQPYCKNEVRRMGAMHTCAGSVAIEAPATSEWVATRDGQANPAATRKPDRPSAAAREAYAAWRTRMLGLIGLLQATLEAGPGVHEAILAQSRAREIAGGQMYVKRHEDGHTSLEQYGVAPKVYTRPDGSKYQVLELPEEVGAFVRDHMLLSGALASANATAGDLLPERDIGLLARSLMAARILVGRATV